MEDLQIYSIYPEESIEPQIAEDLWRQHLRQHLQREEYPALSWNIRELVKSQWRNVHMGTLNIINRIEDGPGGRPFPCFPSRFGSLDNRESPGFWWVQHFIIENWLRVDHWPPVAQLPWFGLELRRLRDLIAQYETKLRDMEQSPSTDLPWVINRDQCQQDILYYQRQVKYALQRLQNFVSHHKLQIPVSLLNEGIELSKKPQQMNLF